MFKQSLAVVALMALFPLSLSADTTGTQESRVTGSCIVAQNRTFGRELGLQRRSADACGESSKPVLLAEFGDAGHGACGGFCNDIRPDYRSQCNSKQRPMYEKDGRCMCQYKSECGG